MKIMTTTPIMNNNQRFSQANGNKNIKFGAALNPAATKKTETEAMGFFKRMQAKVTNNLVKILDSKPTEKLVLATKKHPKIVEKLTPHLIVTGSTILSGFYMVKTLQNKNMDEDKRKTLAVNQGLVWVVSTFMAYTFDGWARKWFNKNILAEFEKATAHLDETKRNTLKSGMEIARPVLIVDMVYRFIAPVLVTPFANAIGNRLQDAHKKAKQAKLDRNKINNN